MNLVPLFSEEHGLGSLDILLFSGLAIIMAVFFVFLHSTIVADNAEDVDSFAWETGSWVQENVEAQLAAYSGPQNANGNDTGNENWTCKLDGNVKENLTSKEAVKLRQKGWDCSPD